MSRVIDPVHVGVSVVFYIWLADGSLRIAEPNQVSSFQGRQVDSG